MTAKDPAAQALAKKRWAKLTTKAQRRKATEAMNSIPAEQRAAILAKARAAKAKKREG